MEFVIVTGHNKMNAHRNQMQLQYLIFTLHDYGISIKRNRT